MGLSGVGGDTVTLVVMLLATERQRRVLKTDANIFEIDKHEFIIFSVDIVLTDLSINSATEDRCHYKAEVRLESEEDKT